MNTRFGTYAAHWIKQSIRRALINTGKAIRIPAYVAQMLHELRRVSIELQEALGRPPALEEVAARLVTRRPSALESPHEDPLHQQRPCH
jgi:RNA polymerase primary sigma factor